ncbi:hypothetical protein EPN42_04535 [bacterium]|nr:MAG: hypothetical protein EPN42_04535 [bacterium]
MKDQPSLEQAVARFAAALARHDRCQRLPQRTESQIRATVRRYVRCLAVITPGGVTLTARDLTAAVDAYREVRPLSRTILPANDGAQVALFVRSNRVPRTRAQVGRATCA